LCSLFGTLGQPSVFTSFHKENKENDELKPGDKVVISAGQLRNLIGIFEREVKGSERSMIVLSAIGY